MVKINDLRYKTKNTRTLLDRYNLAMLLLLLLIRLVCSYDALKGGSTAEAMEDFTGGMTELVDLGDKAPSSLFDVMARAHSRCSLMACSIDADPSQMEANGPLGLIMGHAYSITDVKLVS